MNKWDIVDYARIQSDILKEVFKKIDKKKHKDIIVGDYKDDVAYIINGNLLVIIPQMFNMLSLPRDYISMSLDKLLDKLIPDIKDFEKATNYNTVINVDKRDLRLIETDNILVKVDNSCLKYFNLDNVDFAIYIKDSKSPVVFFDNYNYKVIGVLMPVVNY